MCLKSNFNHLFTRSLCEKSTTLRIEEIEKRRDQIRQKHYDVPNLNSNINVKFDINDDGLYLNTKNSDLQRIARVPTNPNINFKGKLSNQGFSAS